MPRQEYHPVQGAYPSEPSHDPFLAHLREVVWDQRFRAAELAGCDEGGDHVPATNEVAPGYIDCWCGRCGERLLLPGMAGWSPDYVPGVERTAR